MSNKGIYTALSGAMAQSQRLDTIANNIANTNTTSFKKDAQTFKEYVTANEKPPEVIQVPKVPASIESFYDMQGGDRGYVDGSGTYTDFSQGPMQKTNNALDISLQGRGFYEVLSENGIQMTRDGGFRRSAEGLLVTKKGLPVLRQAAEGVPPEQRTIKIPDGRVTVTFDGTIFTAQGGALGKLSAIDFEDLNALQKVGGSNYQLKPNFEVNRKPAEVSFNQGFLEGSNVNVIKEMTDMISATRAFESTQKAIKAFDEMNGRLVNDVPKVR